MLETFSSRVCSNDTFNPDAKESTFKDQKKALISGIFLDIFTVGICYLVCLIKYHNRQFKLAEIGDLGTQKVQTVTAPHVSDIEKTKLIQSANVSHPDHQAVNSDTSPIVNLWLHLEQNTQVQLQGLEFLSEDDLNHRFSNIRCPKKTAVSIAGQHLHANKVGEGIAQRSFVASQAPLIEDFETFWKAVFEAGSTIFDLTTIKDQADGGVTKYYPDELNKSVRYGSISVTLIGLNGYTYVYQIENVETRTVKNITRCHYADWKDFGAVSLSELHALVQKVETLSPNPKDLIWIHCRAGVGRTGTLITALILKEKIERGEINEENLVDSLEDIIIELRKQRGCHFVQQKAQLGLLYQYAHFLIETLKTI